MTEEKNNQNENEENIGQIPQTPVVIHSQYLKDMSFENPNAPEILYKANQPPEVDVNFEIDTRKIENGPEEHYYEVVLTINAQATRADKTMFLAEIKYGTTVSIHGMDEKRHHPLLFVEVPRIMFPFVRLLLSNATQSGGFTPLQISPVDFRSMYIQRFGKENKEDA